MTRPLIFSVTALVLAGFLSHSYADETGIIVEQTGTKLKKSRKVKTGDIEIPAKKPENAAGFGQSGDYQDKILNDPYVNEKARSMAVINQYNNQSKDANIAVTQQEGNDNRLIIKQKGKNNTAIRSQSGAHNEYLIIQQDNDNDDYARKEDGL